MAMAVHVAMSTNEETVERCVEYVRRGWLCSSAKSIIWTNISMFSTLINCYKFQEKCRTQYTIQTILLRFYIYLKCVYSQHAHKVLSAMLSAMHSHKKRPSLVHSTSHPVSSSPLPQLLFPFGSFITVFSLLSFILTFYVISVCFWLQKPKFHQFMDLLGLQLID